MTQDAAQETGTTTQAEPAAQASESPTQADIDKLNAAIAKERDLRKEAERSAKEGKTALERLAEIESASATETEKAVAAARKEGETAATQRTNARLVKAEARALAAQMSFADPSDVALADLSEVGVDDDGEVDMEAVKTAIQSLIESKPHLLKKAPDTSASDAGIGAAGAVATDGSPGSLIRAGLAQTSKSQ